jgi:hypothetical protein
MEVIKEYGIASELGLVVLDNVANNSTTIQYISSGA